MNKKVLGMLACTAVAASMAVGVSAEGDLITIGYAQVGHESDWRTANTKNYEDVFSEENGYELSLIDCDNDNAKQLEAVRNFITQGNGLHRYRSDPVRRMGYGTSGSTGCRYPGYHR